MAAKPKTIDDYLAVLSDDQRAALEKLRKTIKSAAPKAEECISYGLAAFRLDGKPLVAFGATANHCAFYPMSSSTVNDHRDELKNYDTSKGTIRFTSGQSTTGRPGAKAGKSSDCGEPCTTFKVEGVKP